MRKQSAGVLPYRFSRGGLEVLLVHPGGPYWARKDLGAWSIPKGEFEPGEDPRDAARREFQEETGFTAEGTLVPLTPRLQPGGKLVHAWALRGDWDPGLIRSNNFSLEWPPRSGQMREFPEADRAEWFALDEARRRILPGQVPFLVELEVLSARPAAGEVS
jgi:predicted NUDIX family NTP pyrophosphohydrolase